MTPETQLIIEQESKDFFLKYCDIESTIASASYRFALFNKGYLTASSKRIEETEQLKARVKELEEDIMFWKNAAEIIQKAIQKL